jgi:hypothetical protein
VIGPAVKIMLIATGEEEEKIGPLPSAAAQLGKLGAPPALGT